MSVRQRLHALEKQRRHGADRLDQLMRDDPRLADPAFRREIRDWDRRLTDEAKALEQMRQATRGLIGLMWEMAGDPERAGAVRRGHGRIDHECGSALMALSEEQRYELRTACHELLEDLRGGQAGAGKTR